MIQEKQPFKLVKEDLEAGKKLISELVVRLYHVGYQLLPLLPKTGEHICMLAEKLQMPEKPLFVRI